MSETEESSAPVLRAEKPEFLTEKRFDAFELPAPLLSALNDAGFVQCTPIQEQTLPISLSGRDVAGQAQTGTGKTAAFLVTVITRLLMLSDRNPRLPSALIIAPTRELSHQIYEEARTLGRQADLKIAEVVGGVDYKRQAQILRHGVDIVICTPGRIIDYYKQGIFKTEAIKILVIDEADRLFDLGFTKDMRYLLRKLPVYEKRQSMLFSATLSYRVMELTYEFMNLPEFISVTPQTITVEGIDQQLFHVGSEKKLELLLGLLKREEWNRVLIFVNTKVGVDWLTRKLKGNGWPAEKITGDLPQRKRFRLMAQFKNGQIKILVATDVASRGIHVEDISHVINYDLPQDSENYVHRIGRTARAGKTGKAFALACEDYVYHLEPLEEMLGYKLPVVWPGNDWYEADKSKPIVSERRSRLRKSGRKRSQHRAKKRSQTPATSKKDKTRSFPGAFFGFGPESPKGTDTPKTKDSEKPAPPKRSKRKKRSPSRAKKKPKPNPHSKKS
ncbi:MAG: DEAD/DEAH box helicase [Desulfobacterales bacterium]|jgi:ATP-dependent RNA helicase RhlB|nr:DEAD/DEAH box helicase [Deltaproteobacteria bacterium]